YAVRTEFCRAKEHVMRTAQLQRSEIEFETWLQFLTVPCVGVQELFFIFAFLVPVRQERTGKIEPFPIPALRHHVDLSPNLLLINLFRLMRIRNIEDAALTITETIDEQGLIISAKADIDR